MTKLNVSKYEPMAAVNEYLEDHRPKHDGNPKKCEQCGTVFWTENQLDKHIKETHKVDMKKCEECNLSFEVEEDLKQHINKEHEQSILVQQKKRGFKKSNQQDQCEENQVIDTNLETHNRNHVLQESDFECNKCDKIFSSNNDLKEQLEIHNTSKHKFKTRQYNCEDCAFQGENIVELKRHVERAGHRPSKYKETCYTCKKEFYGYFELMAHRNYEHPSNKVCRYFKRDECIFSSEKCWYKHTTQSENDREKQVS